MQKARIASHPSPRGPRPAAPRARVLLVDDDDAILETTAALLEGAFEVRSTSDALEALRLAVGDARAPGESFDVVCCDYRMPSMDGLTLLTRIGERCASTVGILITGERQHVIAHAGGYTATSVFSVVLKPYDIEELTALLRQAGSIALMKRTASALTRKTSR